MAGHAGEPPLPDAAALADGQQPAGAACGVCGGIEGDAVEPGGIASGLEGVYLLDDVSQAMRAVAHPSVAAVDVARIVDDQVGLLLSAAEGGCRTQQVAQALGRKPVGGKALMPSDRVLLVAEEVIIGCRKGLLAKGAAVIVELTCRERHPIAGHQFVAQPGIGFPVDLIGVHVGVHCDAVLLQQLDGVHDALVAA